MVLHAGRAESNAQRPAGRLGDAVFAHRPRTPSVSIDRRVCDRHRCCLLHLQMEGVLSPFRIHAYVYSSVVPPPVVDVLMEAAVAELPPLPLLVAVVMEELKQPTPTVSNMVS